MELAERVDEVEIVDQDDRYVIRSLPEWIATTLLLSDRGYNDFAPGDDEDSQRFASEVRRLNEDWTPGTNPVLPPTREIAEAATMVTVAAPVSRTAPARVRGTSREARPRAHRSGGSASRGSPGRPDDDPDLPPVACAGGCGKTFVPRRPNQTHCTPACRKRAARNRADRVPAHEPFVVELIGEWWRATNAGATAAELIAHPEALDPWRGFLLAVHPPHEVAA
jgi:hypothetical protein